VNLHENLIDMARSKDSEYTSSELFRKSFVSDSRTNVVSKA